MAAAVAVGAACLVLAMAAYAVTRDAFADQLAFGLLGLGAAVAATGWLAAVA